MIEKDSLFQIELNERKRMERISDYPLFSIYHRNNVNK